MSGGCKKRQICPQNVYVFNDKLPTTIEMTKSQGSLLTHYTQCKPRPFLTQKSESNLQKNKSTARTNDLTRLNTSGFLLTLGGHAALLAH